MDRLSRLPSPSTGELPPSHCAVSLFTNCISHRYPNGFAWQLKAPRQAIRKQDQFKKFQHFLVHEADVGNISRQEAVSMIPPLLLDVQPHHYVRCSLARRLQNSPRLTSPIAGPRHVRRSWIQVGPAR